MMRFFSRRPKPFFTKSQLGRMPQHVGLILDGNRRWAKHRGLATLIGHRRGLACVEGVVREAFSLGVKFVSLFVFSSENWKRSKKEVECLMSLFLRFCREDSQRLIAEGFQIRFAGRTKQDLSEEIQKSIRQIERKSKKNTGPTVVVCLNYGGRLELVDAVQKIIKRKLKPSSVNEKRLSQHLYHPDVPDLDLIIRTSGEQRISGFQLWRATYAEFLFVRKCWPDFRPRDLRQALAIYVGRSRRFGGN